MSTMSCSGRGLCHTLRHVAALKRNQPRCLQLVQLLGREEGSVDRAADRGHGADVGGGGVGRRGIMHTVHADVARGQLRALVYAAVGVHVEYVGGVGQAHDDLFNASVL